MYVVPYVMGPAGSPFSKVGVELTDSVYVVLNMRIMTRMGRVALDMLGDAQRLQPRPALHARPRPRAALHLPLPGGQHDLVDRQRLRRQRAARQEVPRAPHRLLPRPPGRLARRAHADPRRRRPEGEKHYVAAAFPSACGKTNFAMMIPPARFKGWKISTVGDDIAWMRVGKDGRLWAVNPENGYFGVAPGTNNKTNPNAMASVARDTIFTNVAMTKDGDVWWEGKDGEPPAELTDWQGDPWTPGVEDDGRAPELPLHRADAQQPDPLRARRRSGRRADLGDHLRRPPRDHGAARHAELQLGARRLPRRHHGLGDHGRRDRQGRRRAPRPDGDAALLRLRHGRLLRALADDAADARRSAADLPGQLVPQGRGRQVPVARLRREHARPRLDPRPRPGSRRGHETLLGWVPRPGDLDVDGPRPHGRAGPRRRPASTSRSGAPSSNRKASSSTSSNGPSRRRSDSSASC